jgi:hypothetical protein
VPVGEHAQLTNAASITMKDVIKRYFIAPPPLGIIRKSNNGLYYYCYFLES